MATDGVTRTGSPANERRETQNQDTSGHVGSEAFKPNSSDRPPQTAETAQLDAKTSAANKLDPNAIEPQSDNTQDEINEAVSVFLTSYGKDNKINSEGLQQAGFTEKLTKTLLLSGENHQHLTAQHLLAFIGQGVLQLNSDKAIKPTDFGKALSVARSPSHDDLNPEIVSSGEGPIYTGLLSGLVTTTLQNNRQHSNLSASQADSSPLTPTTTPYSFIHNGNAYQALASSREGVETQHYINYGKITNLFEIDMINALTTLNNTDGTFFQDRHRDLAEKVTTDWSGFYNREP